MAILFLKEEERDHIEESIIGFVTYSVFGRKYSSFK